MLVELCLTADEVRGYEHIKMEGVARFRARAQELSERIEQGRPAPVTLPLFVSDGGQPVREPV